MTFISFGALKPLVDDFRRGTCCAMDAEPTPADPADAVVHTPVLYVAPLLALGLMLSSEMAWRWRSKGIELDTAEYLMISGL